MNTRKVFAIFDKIVQICQCLKSLKNILQKLSLVGDASAQLGGALLAHLSCRREGAEAKGGVQQALREAGVAEALDARLDGVDECVGGDCRVPHDAEQLGARLSVALRPPLYSSALPRWNQCSVG